MELTMPVITTECVVGDVGRKGWVGVVEKAEAGSPTFTVRWLYDGGKRIDQIEHYPYSAVMPLDPVEASKIENAGLGTLLGSIRVLPLSKAQFLGAISAMQTQLTTMKRQQSERFWMVASTIEGANYAEDRGENSPPRKKHPTEESALQQASEMAQRHNRPFVVLGVVAVVRPQERPITIERVGG